MGIFSGQAYPELLDSVQREYEDFMKFAKPDIFDTGIVQVDNITSGTGGDRIHKEDFNQSKYAKQKVEGGQTALQKIQNGYDKKTTMDENTKAQKAIITLEMRHGGKEKQIENRLLDLGPSVMQRQNLDVTHRLTFAWSTSYVDLDGRTIDVSTGDSLSLINNAHTTAGSAFTYSNYLPLNPVFSETALAQAEDLFRNMKDNLGAIISIRPDVIITSMDPTTTNAVRRLLQSTAQISAANAGVVNVYEGKYSHHQLVDLDTTATGARDNTKSAYWFLASTVDSTFHCDIYIPAMEVSGDQNPEGRNIDTLDWTFTAAMNYDMCIVNGQWIVGSKGD